MSEQGSSFTHAAVAVAASMYRRFMCLPDDRKREMEAELGTAYTNWVVPNSRVPPCAPAAAIVLHCMTLLAEQAAASGKGHGAADGDSLLSHLARDRGSPPPLAAMAPVVAGGAGAGDAAPRSSQHVLGATLRNAGGEDAGPAPARAAEAPQRAPLALVRRRTADSPPASTPRAALQQAALARCLQVLEHACGCAHPTGCARDKCGSMKAFLEHGRTCPTRASGGCRNCLRYWALLHRHSQQCRAAPGTCRVPQCAGIGAVEGRKRARVAAAAANVAADTPPPSMPPPPPPSRAPRSGDPRVPSPLGGSETSMRTPVGAIEAPAGAAPAGWGAAVGALFTAAAQGASSPLGGEADVSRGTNPFSGVAADVQASPRGEAPRT